MMMTVRSKVDRAPKHNYSIAACDVCRAECDESRQPGKTGPKARDKTLEVAHGLGWIDRRAEEKRGRRTETIIQLVCPACQAKGGAVDG